MKLLKVDMAAAFVSSVDVPQEYVGLGGRGLTSSEEDWNELGILVLKAEREFNRNAGFTNKDDRLPKMFYEEPLPPHNKVVVISDEEMDETFGL